MFVLRLSDPVWEKLDDAHRDQKIPEILGALTQKWDGEAANTLFWDYLCHQDTCYGATYASVPYFLNIANSTSNQHAISDIATFLGYVSIVAFRGNSSVEDELQGLPLSVEAWDQRLDAFRSLAVYARKDLADPDYPPTLEDTFEEVLDHLKSVLPNLPKIEKTDYPPQITRERRQAELDQYEELLGRPPVDQQDLLKIARIRQTFIEVQTTIAELCAQVYKVAEGRPSRDMISGVAAGLGDRKLARLFSFGNDGTFNCGICGWEYQYTIYDHRMACYASPVGPKIKFRAVSSAESAMLDYQDGAPNRADGFVQPSDGKVLREAAKKITQLTTMRHDDDNAGKLWLFTGTYRCTKCDALIRLS